jgi:hypothetical protein
MGGRPRSPEHATPLNGYPRSIVKLLPMSLDRTVTYVSGLYLAKAQQGAQADRFASASLRQNGGSALAFGDRETLVARRKALR